MTNKTQWEEPSDYLNENGELQHSDLIEFDYVKHVEEPLEEDNAGLTLGNAAYPTPPELTFTHVTSNNTLGNSN